MAIRCGALEAVVCAKGLMNTDSMLTCARRDEALLFVLEGGVVLALAVSILV